MSFLLILTTESNQKKARGIADTLLRRKLAACVTISSVAESHYRWKGKRCKSREVMLFIKTRAALYSKLEKVLRSVHSYDNPEILAIPVKKGSASYMKWIAAETKS